MQKITVFTSTRAEYGLLYWLIKELHESADFELQLVVAGTHLSHEYGYTVNDIIADGFTPNECISTLIADDSPQAITRSSAMLAMVMGDYFARENPDYIIVLGDRIELMAVCEAAVIAKIPIVHLHGGEITEGAVDEKVRHAISKLASLHFTSTEAYRRRVIQMGENPERVYNCGALGLESMARQDAVERKQMSESVGISVDERYFLIVYHPETHKKSENIDALLQAIEDFPDYKKLFIYPNSDMMSRDIIEAIQAFAAHHPQNVLLIKSLQRDIYLSLMKHCELYLGNSSSGIIEMPSFKRPIINIGDRQRGRIRSIATLDVELDYHQISNAISTAMTTEHQERVTHIDNPYQGSAPSSFIADVLRNANEKVGIQKTFFDLDFNL
ncbi:UDP-N-acetylglucosamine 2-epimerase [Halomonas alkaliantarctica]|uniref:UDP-N-acetylglucosamine 2-epimerase n=1 Tax=Halomonas alkaliantarctica TaxID=232346 RepID=A0ABY8LQC4_9GAMM|nr:UDP-N-acetylglucosamine 2-epimerase [Halomonas alkaliantarctica]WGI26624.1 UDP-N-acetylglucosamine 2-epimerase [Halomonas alkaliantarctica]